MFIESYGYRPDSAGAGCHRRAVGYGDPFERAPARVAADVRNGFVSVGAAEREYGVVVDPVTFAVDADATARRREAVA